MHILPRATAISHLHPHVELISLTVGRDFSSIHHATVCFNSTAANAVIIIHRTYRRTGLPRSISSLIVIGRLVRGRGRLAKKAWKAWATQRYSAENGMCISIYIYIITLYEALVTRLIFLFHRSSALRQETSSATGNEFREMM